MYKYVLTYIVRLKGSGEFIEVEHPRHDDVTTTTATPNPTDVISIEDQHGNPLEIEVRQGGRPVVNGNAETDSSLDPPAPTRGGIVYEMFDDSGNPIQIEIGPAQIDQIVGEMAPPPEESPIAPPSAVDDDADLKKEISEILEKRIEEENDEESQLKKLLQSMENDS